MSNIATEIKKLNRKILSHVEIELEVLKEEHPETVSTVNNIFKRLRKNILDTIGECERSALENSDGF